MIEVVQGRRRSPELGDNEFRELADNAPVMIWRSGVDKLCDWFSKPWLDYTGRTHEQLLGFGWRQDVHPVDYERCLNIYSDAFEVRKPFAMSYRLRRHDGAYRWFLDNGAPFYRKGEFAGYFGSCVDITEQKELEAHQEVLLEELNHRVKNNLQLIIAFLQISGMHAEGAETKRIITSAVARIQGVGAVQAELHRSSTGYVDLGEYLPNLVRAAIQAESGSKTSITVQAESIQAPFKLASELGLIVNELVTNAIKHAAGENAAVGFTLKRVADELMQFTVRDTGPGFGPEHLYFAESPNIRMRGRGIIGSLVARCNAVISRENDGGAVVTITLPCP